MKTEIIPQVSAAIQVSLKDAQGNVAQQNKQVARAEAYELELALFQSFGTIGYDSYKSWLLGDRSAEGLEMTG